MMERFARDLGCPAQGLEYMEDWYRFQNADAQEEAAADRIVLPRVDETSVGQ